ncbi:MFS transporter [Actinocrispum wychmicini]|uniref:EmrB/QacA subfamily drug resistance transporter n=1 Tax=Actinocrispum wychmicini TaxID=1213861 RepID=A0A4R2JSY5_9PSEU|nr:MFS transporter [Actinocrispum wychmicini]TCO62062.1 EmrB/QacA subfamily drug resistance transporter [Actinocrispum wychmicini]
MTSPEGGEQTAPADSLRARIAQLTPPTQHTVIIVAILVMFLGLLDTTVLGTALPRIVEQLRGDQSLYTWTVTAYLLASIVSTPLYGRYADLRGRKPMLLLGLILFLAGSVGSMLAQSMPELVIFRGVQGLGAGSLMTVVTSLMFDAFPMKRVAKLQAFMGTMLTVTVIGGPFLGGLITDYLGWRAIFGLNLLFGIPALAVLAWLLPSFRPPRRQGGRTDLAGAVLIVVGLALIMLGLTEKSQVTSRQPAEWTSPQVGGLLAGGVVALVLFVLVERRASTPLVPLRLFRSRTFSAALATGLFFSVTMLPTGVFLPLYFQHVRGLSPAESALWMIPSLVAMIGGNRISARLVLYPGKARWVLLSGAVLVTIGSVLFTMISAGTPLVLVTAFALVRGLGLGPSMAAISILTQNAAPQQDVGTAMSSGNMFKSVGQMLGLAVAATIFAHVQATENGALSDGITTAIAIVGGVGGVLAALGALFIEDLPMRHLRPSKPATASR